MSEIKDVACNPICHYQIEYCHYGFGAVNFLGESWKSFFSAEKLQEEEQGEIWQREKKKYIVARNSGNIEMRQCVQRALSAASWAFESRQFQEQAFGGQFRLCGIYVVGIENQCRNCQ